MPRGPFRQVFSERIRSSSGYGLLTLMLICWFLFIIHVDMVEIGGCGNVRLGRNDYIFVKAASKPSGMALHLADKLFSKETLLRSIVQGTKDCMPPTRISAIKGKSSMSRYLHISCEILCSRLQPWHMFSFQTISCIAFIMVNLQSHALPHARKKLSKE